MVRYALCATSVWTSEMRIPLGAVLTHAVSPLVLMLQTIDAPLHRLWKLLEKVQHVCLQLPKPFRGSCDRSCQMESRTATDVEHVANTPADDHQACQIDERYGFDHLH